MSSNHSVFLVSAYVVKYLLVLLLGLFILIVALNFWMGRPERNWKQNVVKANMHTFQIIAETYAVNWTGKFALTTRALQKEGSAAGREYWKEFANPYTGRSGEGLSYQLESQPAKVGIVTYEPVLQDGKVVRYYIYGYDKTGKRIQDKGRDFYLTNS